MDHCSKRGFGVMRRQENALALYTILDDEEAVINLVRNIDGLSLHAYGADGDISDTTEAGTAKGKAPAAIRDPTTWREAMGRKDAAKWIEAIRKEQQSIMDNSTFYSAQEHVARFTSDTLAGAATSMSTTRKPLTTKYHFKTKLGPKGEIIYKVRLVVRGFEQIPEIEFEQTYAPVSKLTSLRLLVAMASEYDWQLTHLDVKAAFLNPMLDRDNIFVTLPKGTAWLAAPESYLRTPRSEEEGDTTMDDAEPLDEDTPMREDTSMRGESPSHEVIEIPDIIYKELGTKGIIPSIPGMHCKLWLEKRYTG